MDTTISHTQDFIETCQATVHINQHTVSQTRGMCRHQQRLLSVWPRHIHPHRGVICTETPPTAAHCICSCDRLTYFLTTRQTLLSHNKGTDTKTLLSVWLRHMHPHKGVICPGKSTTALVHVQERHQQQRTAYARGRLTAFLPLH